MWKTATGVKRAFETPVRLVYNDGCPPCRRAARILARFVDSPLVLQPLSKEVKQPGALPATTLRARMHLVDARGSVIARDAHAIAIGLEIGGRWRWPVLFYQALPSACEKVYGYVRDNRPTIERFACRWIGPPPPPPDVNVQDDPEFKT